MNSTKCFLASVELKNRWAKEASAVLVQGEMMNREVLAKSLVASCDIDAGTTVTEAMVKIQSPGQGLQPNRLHELVGKKLPISKKKDDIFFPSDLKLQSAKPRPFRFAQPFGLPVRYHDISTFSEVSNLDLVEIHLSYKDLEVDLDVVIPEKQTLRACDSCS
jgi:N-acetylneuraminate synthase